MGLDGVQLKDVKFFDNFNQKHRETNIQYAFLNGKLVLVMDLDKDMGTTKSGNKRIASTYNMTNIDDGIALNIKVWKWNHK